MKNNEPLVLITGATGFVGSYLSRLLLKKGYRVRSLKRADSKMDMLGKVANQIEWITGDVLDIVSLEDAMEGVDHLYHCAAMVSYDPKYRQRMMDINVEGTANVVNVALFREIKKMVYISSIAALGKSRHGELVSEQTKWERDKKNTAYSLSKYLAEQEAWRGFAEGLNTAIVNPSIVIGAGRWNQSSVRLFKQVWDGLKFYPQGSNGFVDVRDVARMAVQLMESDISGQRFIANGGNLPFRNLFSQIATGLGRALPAIKVTPLIGSIAWRASWLQSVFTGKSPLLTKESVRSAATTVGYDNEKSKTILDFSYTPLSQTVQETTNVMKKVKGKETGILDINF